MIPDGQSFRGIRRRKLRTNKPPQRQCQTPDPHRAHLFEGYGRLMWSCQGRGKAAT